ncbi:MAG: hypothetical protein DI626_01740 [Micavibrio aeruginosavorus]|uniref:Toxin co-regulated pilus biosynthesis protein Q C-terminal domain-containing protein n=1 Tax=Micavibrio aeruginosavorus TaxID=349221 RepID=A0A2W5A1N8_9BACT|nr:MAG: hypothetical protein DI626_01740 [Micavibrio aeruginosavorus]
MSDSETFMLFKTRRPFLSHSLLAFSAMAMIHVPAAHAQVRAGMFQPGSSWNVGATQLSTAGMKGVRAPCVLSNEYDNGYVVRFSGGNKNMLALAIDFRQDVFMQGRKYNAMLSIGDSYVKQVSATAFTASTLIFNLRPLDDFYSAVQRGKSMELSIDSNDMVFSLAGIAQTFPDLESCYAGQDAPVVAPMVDPQTRSAARSGQHMRPVKVPGVETAALPQSFDAIVQGADMQQSPAPLQQADMAEPVSASMNVAPPAPVAAQEIRPVSIPQRVSRTEEGMTAMPVSVPVPAASSAQWQARSGEDIRTVLSRWADTAGYDIDWQAAQSGKVVQDVSLNGSFEEAVAQLMAENAAVTGVAAHVEKDGATKTLSGGSSFSAQAGANARTVLSQWASREGVELVWNNAGNVALKKPVSAGSFEGAVEDLLDQYSDDSQRPVGSLNRDPDSGRRTLTIDMDRAG